MRGAQLPLAVQLRETASFASFHTGPNTEAVAALRELRQPLFLYGPPRSGRTHLLQATCRMHGGAYAPLAAFAELGSDALDGYASASAVYLDDIDAVCADRSWCLALVRLLDGLRSDGRRYVLAAGAAPDRLAVALPDLRTRLAQCAVLGLRTLDDAERAGMLKLRALQRGFELPEDVLRWLLARHARDTASLIEALDALDRATLSAKRRLTLPLAQRVLDPAGARKAPDR